ncbi:MAG: hypothetical protein MUE91_07860 [Ignavibacteriaceae bacterium]|nr:hypothetical protein [Ignavibacteriaceae bacterium]
MIEITRKIKERAMLVAVQTRNLSRELVEEHLSELEELADTAGADSIFKIIQSKSAIDPAFYIGKGKAEELAQLIRYLKLFNQNQQSIRRSILEREKQKS